MAYPIPSWKVEAKELTSDCDEGAVQNSIANCVNLILTDLIDAEIPHNLLISDKGHTFYVIPRQFDDANLPLNTCWNDVSGVITVRDKNLFDGACQFEDIILETLTNQVSIGVDKFKELTNNMVSKFEGLYIIEKL